MSSTEVPVLFGYQTVRVDAPKEALTQGQRSLEAFAEREGYSLGTIFVERDPNKPLSALLALIETAKREDVTVVAVPTPMDLGRMPRVRQLTRATLQREAGVRVLVVDPKR